MPPKQVDNKPPTLKGGQGNKQTYFSYPNS